MTQVPPDLLHKESLTPEDWEVLVQHPAAGAKLLLQKSDEHDIAAVAAYEHHARADGSGYPRMRFPRNHHYVSKIISICDAYDALRAPKPYRDAWDVAAALEHIEEQAGKQFDHGVATSFVAMMRQLDERQLLLAQPATQYLPPGSDPLLAAMGTTPEDDDSEQSQDEPPTEGDDRETEDPAVKGEKSPQGV